MVLALFVSFLRIYDLFDHVRCEQTSTLFIYIDIHSIDVFLTYLLFDLPIQVRTNSYWLCLFMEICNLTYML